MKLLTKHKAMELEIDTHTASRDRLVTVIQLHEYNRERGQFLAWTWIREMMAGARSGGLIFTALTLILR